jgi:hypothetical protein
MKYGDTNSNVDWKEVFVENFMSSIQYHKIPANVLMNEVEPLKLVPYEVIMTSLAYQVRKNYYVELNKYFFLQKKLYAQ